MYGIYAVRKPLLVIFSGTYVCIRHVFFDIAHMIVCVAGSVKRSSVRLSVTLSVCPSIHPFVSHRSAVRAAGLLLSAPWQRLF